jgi:hypothetical protein
MSAEERKITITLTGPPGMLESMATTLRDEGYTVLPAGSAEKVVLDAMGALPEKLLRSWVDASQITRGLPQLAIAELVRRGLKP